MKPHSERMKLGHGLFYIFTTRANCNFLSFSDSLFYYKMDKTITIYM